MCYNCSYCWSQMLFRLPDGTCPISIATSTTTKTTQLQRSVRIAVLRNRNFCQFAILVLKGFVGKILTSFFFIVFTLPQMWISSLHKYTPIVSPHWLLGKCFLHPYSSALLMNNGCRFLCFIAQNRHLDFQSSSVFVFSEFAVSLETVLAGHENWVYGLHWQPPTYQGAPVWAIY